MSLALVRLKKYSAPNETTTASEQQDLCCSAIIINNSTNDISAGDAKRTEASAAFAFYTLTTIIVFL